MRLLAIFTRPEDATVTLVHDVGVTFTATDGEADGRPAHLLQIDGVPDGNGAQLIIRWPDGVTLEPRGVLWVGRPGPRAEFSVDDFTKPTRPPPAVLHGPLRIEGDHFLQGDQLFLVRGSTDFRIPEQALEGEDIGAILDDRIACGANWFRMLAMKKNNTGYRLDPRDPRHDDAVRRTFDAIGDRGAYGQWCVFADTAEMMPDPHEQQDFFAHEQEVLQPYAAFALLELCNEASHPSQKISPAAFTKPTGFLSSHGSELADRFPVRPLWDWGGYSARRSGGLGKIIANYAQLTSFEQWPPVCLVPQETIKPDEHYNFDPVVAWTLGKYARAGTGGVFHHNAWRDCRPFTEGERACAVAFYRALQEVA